MRFERGEKLVRLLDGRGEIGVGEKDDAAAGFQKAVAHAESLAAIRAVRDDAQSRDFAAEGFGDGGGAVVRAVIDDNDFRLAAAPAEVRGNPAQSFGQAALFVVRRDNDGESRAGGHSAYDSRQP